MRPFFSIIIPTYNQADYLIKCLDSVFKQTFDNFEIIVIDNYSTDKTYEIIKNSKKKIIYKKIKNKGIIAKSRNLGLKLASGQWISFLDSDDFWTRDKLEKTYNLIKLRKFDVICNDEWEITKENKKKSKILINGPFEKDFYKKLLLYGNRNSTSASTINNSFLKKNKIKFNEKKIFNTCEDFDFFLKISFYNGIFYYLNLPLGYHLFHSNSSSANKKNHQKSLIELIKYHVFNVQKFTNKKKFFYKQFKNNAYAKKILIKFFEDKNYKNFIILVQSVFEFRLAFMKMFFFLARKVVKRLYLEFKYTNTYNNQL